MQAVEHIYLDYAATTPLSETARRAMMPWMEEAFGNPSSPYRAGNRAAMALADAREVLGRTLNASPEEIFFTSGGTEANNWALIAGFDAFSAKGRHIITSKAEHESVLNTCRYLEKVRGAEVTYLDVDEYGFVHPESLVAAIQPGTILISIMAANNEVGTVQDLAALGAVAREHDIPFHTDAVQAYGKMPLDMNSLPIDMMSVSAHKVYGPKGVGMLYIRNGIRLTAFVHGGAQQRGRRAGTENVAGIVGFAAAAKEAVDDMVTCTERERMLRDYLIERMEREVPGALLNGDRKRRLPGNVHFSFDCIDGESMVIAMDMRGFCVSAGSACSSGSVEPSHVLLAMGRSFAHARGALRITIGEKTEKEAVDAALENIKEIVAQSRAVLHDM
ncbi:MAG: cysteine desulfurase family protein [Eubacteriales bacterium]|nr:cysteine desulfurase family protein [Eubacteriales bacterium]